MAEPRIGIVIGTFFPEVGGAEVQALNHARALREAGSDVEIVTLRHQPAWLKRETIGGVSVVRVDGPGLAGRDRLPAPLRKLAYLGGIVGLGAALWQRRARYDLLCLYQLNPLVLPLAAVCYLARKPLVIQLHTDNRAVSARAERRSRLDRLRSRLEEVSLRTAVRMLRGRPAVMVALSERTERNAAAAGFGIPVLRIPNGVDVDRFKPKPRRKRHPGHPPTVVSVTRLAYPKGVDILLRAWQLVQTEEPDARLVIVGDGPLEAELRTLAIDLGIVESVKFAGRHDDVVAQLHRGDIAVLASRWEGMPVALLEAMACGLPCVGTRVSGSEDLVQTGTNGFLVEPGDTRGLADALLLLIRDPAMAEEFGRAARATIERDYSLPRTIEQYRALYASLTGTAPSPAGAETPAGATSR